MIRIRSILTTRRHALAAVAAIIALGLAVAFAHGTPANDHMGATGGMDDARAVQSAIAAMCLAVVELGTAGAAGLLALWLLVRRPFTGLAGRWFDLFRVIGPMQCRPPPAARAGPSLLQVYRL